MSHFIYSTDNIFVTHVSITGNLQRELKVLVSTTCAALAPHFPQTAQTAAQSNAANLSISLFPEVIKTALLFVATAIDQHLLATLLSS